MLNSSKLLDQGFKKALQEAATLDQQHLIRDDDFGLLPGQVLPSNVELVRRARTFTISIRSLSTPGSMAP